MKQTVLIKQKLSFAEQANANDPAVAEYHAGKFTGIGSYFKGKNPASGLSRDEVRFVMEEILDMDNTDREFKSACTLYFHEIFTKITSAGKLLRIDLMDPTKALGASLDGENGIQKNLPVEPVDWVIWRHALSHPQVGSNRDEAEESFGMKFYIEDKERDLTAALSLNDLVDKASSLYLENKGDENKIKQVLTLLGVDIKGKTAKTLPLEFKKASTAPTTGENATKKEFLEKFIKVCEDKNLEKQYFIMRLVGAQILERVGTRFVVAESGDELGGDMKETLLNLFDPTNSQQLNMFQARLKEFSK